MHDKITITSLLLTAFILYDSARKPTKNQFNFVVFRTENRTSALVLPDEHKHIIDKHKIEQKPHLYNVQEKYLKVKQLCETTYFKPNRTKIYTLRQIKQLGNSVRQSIDKVHNIVYCLSAKTGVTNWKKLAVSVLKNSSIENLHKIVPKGKLYSYLPTMKEFKIFTVKTGLIKPKHGILLARHPLLRLYSAWAHRLSNSEAVHFPTFKRQIKYMHENCTRLPGELIPKGQYVSLAQFLRFVSEPGGTAHSLLKNVHWEKVNKRCHVCEMIEVYDMVVNTETSDQDSEEVVKVLENSFSEKLQVGKFPSAYQHVVKLKNGTSVVESDLKQKMDRVKEY